MKVVGILLAGGAAKRFGSNKLLHPLGDGTPIGVAAARNLVAALPETIAVLRPRAQKLGHLLREAGCKTVVCRNASEGMGATLARAVRASKDADAWIVALADMPWIRPESIRMLAGVLSEGALIAAPSYKGERGHPVGFAARFRDELTALTGDEGARSLVLKYAESFTLHPVDDPGVLSDIDTPSDIAGGRDTRTV